MSWIYKQTETGQYPLWTVGTDDEDWQTDSDHDTRESAANRCAYLNGAPHDYIKLKEQNEKLKKAVKQLLPMAEFSYEHSKKACAHQEFLNDDRDTLYNAREALKSCES